MQSPDHEFSQLWMTFKRIEKLITAQIEDESDESSDESDTSSRSSCISAFDSILKDALHRCEAYALDGDESMAMPIDHDQSESEQEDTRDSTDMSRILAKGRPSFSNVSGSTPTRKGSRKQSLQGAVLIAKTAAAAAAAQKAGSRTDVKEERQLLEDFNANVRDFTNDYRLKKDYSEKFTKCKTQCQAMQTTLRKYRPKGPGRRFHLGAGFFLNLPFAYFDHRLEDISSENWDWKSASGGVAIDTLTNYCLLAASQPNVSDPERIEWRKGKDLSWVKRSYTA